ncbi:MAG: hypothetical protein ACR2Q4_03400 [Geminicoccaceae bacterium]
MNAVILVVSWTLFTPPAHDVDIRTMPDMPTCLDFARSITEQVSDLERGGLGARLVARCVAVPTNLGVGFHPGSSGL